MSKQLVTVLGATGKQGGSVVSALLAHGGFAIRGVTRNTDSPAAHALIAKGIEMVAGEMSEKESLLRVCKGAYAVFGVTMPWQPTSEDVQGRNIVDACKANDVPLLVWSSLPDAKKVSGGKYTKIKHWDEKALVDEYIVSVGQPAVILYTGAFLENIDSYHFLHPDRSNPEKFQLSWPLVRSTVPLAHTYVAADFGNCVAKVIEKWDDPMWKEKLVKEPLIVCSFRATGDELVEVIKRLSGTDVVYDRIPHIPGEESMEMMKLVDDGLVFPHAPLPTPIFVEMGVKFHSFEDYTRETLLPMMAGPVVKDARMW